MNFAQLSAFKSIISGPLPNVASVSTFTTDSATITITVPRAPGKLCVAVIFNIGGTAVPGTLSGFTSGSAAASASIPGYAVQRRFLTGLEAVTLTSTATGSTGMTAHVYLIEGVVAFRTIPTPQNDTGTSATAYPPAISVTSGANKLWFVAAAWATNPQDLTGMPAGYSTRNYSGASAAGLSSYVAAENNNLSSQNPTAFEGSTSAGWRTATFAVLGLA